MSKSNIVLRKKILSNGEYPIVIRLTKPKLSATYIRIDGLSCLEIEWSKGAARFNKNKQDYKTLNISLNDIEDKIDSITTKLLASNKFTYKRFKDLYSASDKIDDNVVNVFNSRIAELKQLNKMGTAKMYSDGLTAFKEYASVNTTFDDIDNKFISGFKKHRLNKGNCFNTLATYLRALRAIVYSYYRENSLTRPQIEFNIKTEPTRHRALTKEQLKKLMDYTPLSKYEKRTIDIFMFSFYCRGANLMDIAQLKTSNIINNRVEYKRSKTGGLFSIPITPQVQIILDYYQGGNYLLPVLKNGKNIKQDVVNFNRSFNKTIARISKNLELPPVTFYYARYTFASILKDSNVGIDIISKLLGHSNPEITKTYLASFCNSELDYVTNEIINFL